MALPTIEYALPFVFQDINTFEAVSGSPTFSTSSLRSGGGDAKMICAAAGAVTRVSLNHAAGKRVLVESFYYLHTGAPAATDGIWQAVNASGNATIQALTGGTLRAQAGGTTGTASSALTNNQWYRIDVRATVSGGVTTVDWYIDGVLQSPASVSQTDADFTATRLGVNTATTHTVHAMDHAGSYTSADFPLGAFRSKLYDVSAPVGANHVLGSGSFQKTGAVAITSGDTNSNAELTEKPFSLTQYVAQTAIDTAAWLEYPVADTSEQTPPSLVRVGSAWAGSAANAYTFELRAYDGTSESSDLTSPSNAAKTGTTTRIPVPANLLTAPSGAAWTVSLFNGLRLRFGRSSDATPNPRLGAVAVMGVHRVPVAYTGAFSVTQSDSLTFTGARTRLAAFALTQTDTLTIAGTRTRLGAFGLTAFTSLTDAGVVTRFGTFSLSQSDALSFAGQRTRSGAFSLAATTLLEATGARLLTSAFGLTASDSLIVSGAPTRLGAFALLQTDSLVTAGNRTRLGAFALTAFASLTDAGVVTRFGTYNLSASTLLSATGQRTRMGGFSLSQADSLLFTGQRTRLGAVNLSALTDLTLSGYVYTSGAFALVANTLLEAEGEAFVGGAFSLTTSPTLLVAGVREVLGGFSLVTPDPVPPVIIVERGGGGAGILITQRPVLGGFVLVARATLTATGYRVEGKVDEEEAIRLALEML